MIAAAHRNYEANMVSINQINVSRGGTNAAAVYSADFRSSTLVNYRSVF